MAMSPCTQKTPPLMTRKLIIALTLVLATSLAAKAQTSVQLFYDFGKHLYHKSGPQGNNLSSRYYLTSTVEHFSADRWGSTFLFTDVYYGNTARLGAAGGSVGAYWEIGRDFNFWQDSKVGWLSAHLEYNGGLDTFSGAGTYSDAWLIGPRYSGHSEDFSKTWSVGLYYKTMPRNAFGSRHSVQLTGVWGLNFCKNMLSFSGFVDVWHENTWFNPDGNITVLAEPQLWFNFNSLEGAEGVNLSVGTEVELSYNFVGCGPGFYCIPTLALKWTF